MKENEIVKSIGLLCREKPYLIRNLLPLFYCAYMGIYNKYDNILAVVPAYGN